MSDTFEGWTNIQEGWTSLIDPDKWTHDVKYTKPMCISGVSIAHSVVSIARRPGGATQRTKLRCVVGSSSLLTGVRQLRSSERNVSRTEWRLAVLEQVSASAAVRVSTPSHRQWLSLHFYIHNSRSMMTNVMLSVPACMAFSYQFRLQY